MIPLCPVEMIGDPGARGFDVGHLSVVAVQIDGLLRVYRNSCPHLGVQLNWMPDQFLDHDLRRIQCSMHGALFEPADGLCIYGPCHGAALTPIPSRIHDGWLLVDPTAD